MAIMSRIKTINELPEMTIETTYYKPISINEGSAILQLLFKLVWKNKNLN